MSGFIGSMKDQVNASTVSFINARVEAAAKAARAEAELEILETVFRMLCPEYVSGSLDKETLCHAIAVEMINLRSQNQQVLARLIENHIAHESNSLGRNVKYLPLALLPVPNLRDIAEKLLAETHMRIKLQTSEIERLRKVEEMVEQFASEVGSLLFWNFEPTKENFDMLKEVLFNHPHLRPIKIPTSTDEAPPAKLGQWQIADKASDFRNHIGQEYLGGQPGDQAPEWDAFYKQVEAMVYYAISHGYKPEEQVEQGEQPEEDRDDA